MGIIRQLEPELINQIAAGEVVERPASVAKELIENALDAGASEVRIRWRDAGQSLLSIEDNGKGMSREDLELCVQRHTTSKISTSSDLFSIRTFGFRGEALAAIGSIARMVITTRCAHEESGWELSIEAGRVKGVRPVGHGQGTRIEVRDLFFATPARLKFMKSHATEERHLWNLVERYAAIHSATTFSVYYGDRIRSFEAIREAENSGIHYERLVEVFGEGIAKGLFPVALDDSNGNGDGDGTRERRGKVHGFASCEHRPSTDSQLFFVNKRCIRDRSLSLFVRMAYGDLLPSNRHPICALSIELDPEELDINVHPAKTEVRFRDIESVRSLVTTAIKQALYTWGREKAFQKPSPVLVPLTIIPREEKPLPRALQHLTYSRERFERLKTAAQTYSPSPSPSPVPASTPALETEPQGAFAQPAEQRPPEAPPAGFSLGEVIGQLCHSYIVAQGKDELILVDAHAGHERIVFEQMKAMWETSMGVVQYLVVPFEWVISQSQSLFVEKHVTHLSDAGFILKPTSAPLVWQVCAIPQIFSITQVEELLNDLLSTLDELSSAAITDMLTELRNHFLGRWACRQSRHFGEALTHDEMDYLLRKIEELPEGYRCNHGRPVYARIPLGDIARWFCR